MYQNLSLVSRGTEGLPQNCWQCRQGSEGWAWEHTGHSSGKTYLVFCTCLSGGRDPHTLQTSWIFQVPTPLSVVNTASLATYRRVVLSSIPAVLSGFNSYLLPTHRTHTCSLGCFNLVSSCKLIEGNVSGPSLLSYLFPFPLMLFELMQSQILALNSGTCDYYYITSQCKRDLADLINATDIKTGTLFWIILLCST